MIQASKERKKGGWDSGKEFSRRDGGKGDDAEARMEGDEV